MGGEGLPVGAVYSMPATNTKTVPIRNNLNDAMAHLHALGSFHTE